jgi:hypothetical protein
MEKWLGFGRSTGFIIFWTFLIITIWGFKAGHSSAWLLDVAARLPASTRDWRACLELNYPLLIDMLLAQNQYTEPRINSSYLASTRPDKQRLPPKYGVVLHKRIFHECILKVPIQVQPQARCPSCTTWL